MTYKLVSILAPVLLSVSVQASVIVQWGSLSAPTVPDSADIVIAHTNLSSKPTSYTSGTATNPTVGAGYYPSASGRTPIFNMAGSMDRGAGAITLQTAHIQNNVNHDRIRLIGTDSGTDLNLVNMTAMVTWESANWLTSDNSLETLNHVGFRQNTGTTDFRFLIQKSDLSWYASTAENWTGGGTGNGAFSIADASAADWFAFTPHSGGTAVVGALNPTLTVDDIISVGYYVDSTDAGAASMGSQTGYFQATATPEPSGSLLLLLGSSLVLIRRRR